MTTESSDQKLNQLAAIVHQLAEQVQQMSQQMLQLGNRLEQTRSSIDVLVNTIRVQSPQQPPSFPAPNPITNQEANWLVRLTQLEEQVSHLGSRVKYLERREVAFAVPSVQSAAIKDEIEDEIEDEPDEILWDFMEQSAKDA